MESRFRIFLLITVLSLFATTVSAADQGSQPAPSREDAVNEVIQQEPVIQPDVKRREVKQADVETENFELGVFAGLLSIEDFGTNPVYGATLDYHVTEDLFVQGRVGFSEGGETSADRLGGAGGPTIGGDRKYMYYTISLGYNLLPGEAFLTRDSAYNTSLYLIAGAGNTVFLDDDFFTVTWGAGYSITISEWFTAHMDFRDYMFDINATGLDKTSHNLEATLDLTFYF